LNPTERPAWQHLARAATDRANDHLGQTLNAPDFVPTRSQELAGVLFDFNKQRIHAGIMDLLLQLADECGVLELRDALFTGEPINASEDRQVLHPALRGGAPEAEPEIRGAVADTQRRMVEIAAAIRSGHWRGHSGKPITDVVHIGIGGSHLGPELVVSALEHEATTHINVHFVANIDSNDLSATLDELNPDTTLFVVVSKSFTTLETLVNATSARAWFVERTNAPVENHFVGVTSNIDAACAFGFDPGNLLPMWDWVGGRYSLWSAVGLPILISLGEAKFKAFLDGARAVDEHFKTTPARDNVPLLSALVGVWNTNFLGCSNHAILAYDERLRLLPDYLQQLEMESNGKSVDRQGRRVGYHTMPILWGGVGSNGQHAYHQLLHQGTRAFSADFIVVANDASAPAPHHDWLLANALGQSQAMAIGYAAPESEPHRDVVGNHPTTTIVLDELGPRQLGALLAVYEHKVFCQGAIWNINSFDQWGVELGKALAKPIYETLAGSATDAGQQEAATLALIEHLKNTKSND
jgi:glucose-6-phosphate isomerase